MNNGRECYAGGQVNLDLREWIRKQMAVDEAAFRAEHTVPVS
jgi:hypothetical protein